MLSQHILVVDDNAAIRDLFVDLFALEGYRVTPCATIDAADHVLEADPPAVIVLDYLFNGQPLGILWLQALQSDPRTCSIPVLLCTAVLRMAPIDSVYVAAHHIPILPKPFVVDEALQAVQAVLARR